MWICEEAEKGKCKGECPECEQGVETILCASVKVDGITVEGRRHANAYTTLLKFMPNVKMTDTKAGFMTSYGRFVDRAEGAKVALKAGQICKETDLLISEDLY